MKRISLIPLALLGFACSASEGAPIERRGAAIAGGSPDTEHDSVFIMAAHQGEGGSICTATLIAPNLLLTARHCVSSGEGRIVVCGASELGEPYPGSAIAATNAVVPADDSRYFVGREVRVPVQGADTCGFDLALVILASNVPAAIAVPAIPRIDRGVEQGETYTAVGYGEDETGEPTNQREMRGGLSIECEPGLCGFGVESTEFRGEAGICSGDSGGPALDEDDKVVGVVSRAGSACESPVYGAVMAWRDWIMEVAAEAAVLGGYAPPFWVVSGTSDPPDPTTPTPLDGGAAGAGPGPALGGQGESCQSPGECSSGHACYSPDGTPESGRCVALCASTGECGRGLVCSKLASSSVCLDASAPDEESGCSVSPGKKGSGWPELLGVGLAGLLRRRRRTRSA